MIKQNKSPEWSYDTGSQMLVVTSHSARHQLSLKHPHSIQTEVTYACASSLAPASPVFPLRLWRWQVNFAQTGVGLSGRGKKAAGSWS